MPHELSENSLTDIHPSLSAIATPVFAPALLGNIRPGKVQIEKTILSSNPLIPSVLLVGNNI
jgi:hypothetical protein